MDGARIDAPLVERGRVTGVIVDGDVRRARWVVAADGSSSTLRRELGMERTVRRRRVGVRAHFRLARREAFHDIQIFMRSGYELYVTPLPRGEVLVAALAFQDAVRSGCAARSAAGSNASRSCGRGSTGQSRPASSPGERRS
jgi:2-polyprenyl-6-methoxyphenol hydroxylase-like FAD-dependent oxidoreductase